MESKRVEEEYQAFMEGNLWPLIYQRIGQRSQAYTYTCIEAKKTENKPLNRYRDVNPYDHSRIILQRENFVTNYINANLVKMERANRQYILTQGPLVFTSGHFWLMVWEQNSPAIIMLNKIIEKNEIKCHWYWPHENGEKHKVVYPDVNISIAQIDENDYSYYTVRKFKMTCLATDESREVWHFHYTTWPDFEVPQSPHAFLDFLSRVQENSTLSCLGNNGPAIVHCSAGIGRSGTFCLVDSVLVLIEKEGQENVDIQEILLEMRRYRMGLIQTSEQLRFSYAAIVEGIKRLDPSYEPPTEPETTEESLYSSVPDEEEAPPLPPPRGESLGRPPARPLPAIPASASMGNIELSSNVESDDSDAGPSPPPRDASPRDPLPRDIMPLDPSSSASSVYDEEDTNTETTESVKEADAAESVAVGDGDGLRRRRAELAERVAQMKKRSRDADRWHSFKRSLFKPIALSVGLLAVAGVIIYAYSKN